MLNMQSNAYHVLYMAIVTIVVAVGLSLAATGLKEKQDYNVALATKTDILGSVNLDTVSNVEAVYNEAIEGVILDTEGNKVTDADVTALEVDVKKESKKTAAQRKLPLFIYTAADGRKAYIVPVRGFGLWDEIWGYVAIKDDLNTIGGIAFDHKAETPGLGAEIKDNETWKAQFTGKKLFEEDGEYVSVEVKKGNITEPEHEVNGISGATMTSDGVSKMLYEDIKQYLPYFEKLKKQAS